MLSSAEAPGLQLTLVAGRGCRLDVDDVVAAIDLHRLHDLSIWDAPIVRAAVIAGCRTLYTEDLRDGRPFESLQVVNPFREVGPTGPA